MRIGGGAEWADWGEGLLAWGCLLDWDGRVVGHCFLVRRTGDRRLTSSAPDLLDVLVDFKLFCSPQMATKCVQMKKTESEELWGGRCEG